MSTSPVTLMVARRVADGRYQDLIAWLREGEQLATDFPGYLGSGVLAPPPGDNEFQIIFRFVDEQTLHAWSTRSRGPRGWRGAAICSSIPRSIGSAASKAGSALPVNGHHAGNRPWRSGWRSSRCRCCSTLSSDRCSAR